MLFSMETFDPLLDPMRLKTLQNTALVDSEAEPAFDRLTKLAIRLLDAPVSLMSLVTHERQFFKSMAMGAEQWNHQLRTQLSGAFCPHVVRSGLPFIVENSSLDATIAMSQHMFDLDIVAYCGIPITLSCGCTLGSFCVIDDKPRIWSAEDIETMQALASAAISEIELRLQLREATESRARLERISRENLLLQDLQEEAENAQDRLVTILEKTSDYVCTANVNGRITYANMAQRTLVSQRHSDGKRSITDYYPEWAVRLLVDEGMPAALAAGVWSGETAFCLPDGRTIPLSLVLIGHRAQSGEHFISAIARDISDRKKAEQALKLSEERYRQLITGAEGVVYEIDFQTNSYVYFDPHIEGIIGYSVEELTPTLWHQRVETIRLSGMLKERDFTEANHCFLTGGLDYWTADYEFCTRSGTKRWLCDSSVPLRDEAGNVRGALGILQDITDRVHSDEALRESELRFRHMADSAPAFIWLSDSEGEATYFNRQWLHYTGRGLEQEKGYGWADGLHPGDLTRYREVFGYASKKQIEYRMEYRLRDASGAFGWFLETGSPRFSADGAFLGYIGSCIDIQEQKKSLEASQLSERRLAEAQQVAHIGSWEFSRTTGLIWWSEETYRLYGMDPRSKAPTFDEHLEQIHPNDRARYDSLVRSAMESGETYDLDFRNLLPDGTSRHIIAHGECLRDPDGKIGVMWGTAQDITDRKAAEQDRVRLLQIIEATPDFVGISDLRGRLMYINLAGRELLGLEEGELPNSIFRYYPSWARKLIHKVGIPTALREGMWLGESAFLSPDGKETPMSQVILVHRNGAGNVEYISSIARDLTERKRTEEGHLRGVRDQAVKEAMLKRNQELQALSRRLVEVQEEERTHIARELHDEIGQNLTGLKLTLGAIPRLQEEGRARNLKLAMDIATELMGQVRAMSLELRPGMLDDLGLLPTLLWHNKRYTAQTGVQVEFEEEGLKDNRFARASETASYRIVQEALTNVARYAEVESVRVSVRLVPDKLYLRIEDMGKGFAPEEVLTAGRSNGLAGMRERALLLGGTFGLQSAPGRGTRLLVELPL